MTPEQQKRYNAQFGPRRENSGRAQVSYGKSNAPKAPSIDKQYKIERKSNAQQFADWTGGVAKGFGSITAGVGKIGVDIAVGTGKAVYGAVENFGIHKMLTGELSRDLGNIQRQQDQLDQQMSEWSNLYKSGKVSKDQYSEMMKSLSSEYQKLSGKSKGIATEADRGDVLEGAGGTLITIISAGKFAPSRVALRSSAGLSTSKVFKGSGLTSSFLAGGSKGAQALNKIEELAARVPAVRALMARNGAVLSNANRSVMNQSLRDATAMALFKHPFVYHATIEDVGDVMREIRDNEMSGGTLLKAAFVTTLAFDGGIFGLATTSYRKGKDNFRVAALGRGSYWDGIAGLTQGNNPRIWVDWLENLRTTNPDGFKRIERVMRQAQESNLQRFSTAEEAVDSVRLHYQMNHGVDLSEISFTQFMKKEIAYWENRLMLDDLAKKGLLKDAEGNLISPGKIALGTFDRQSRDSLIAKLEKLSFQDRVEYLHTLKHDKGVFWAQNEGLFNRVIAAVGKTDDMAEVSKAIRSIDTAFAVKGVPKAVASKLAKQGYVTISPKQNLLKTFADEDTRKLITAYADKGDAVFDAAIAPQPFLGNFYGTMKRGGLSTEAANNVVYKQLQQTVVGNLDQTDVARSLGIVGDKDMRGSGAIILSKLQSYAENKLPARIAGKISKTNAITDIRQLRIGEISEALDVTKAQAKEIARAINNGYMQMPLEMRGLGDRLVDRMFAYVPGFKHYNRAQGALRYTYNPFFRTQEIVETKILSKMKGGNLLWGRTRSQLDDIAKQLDEAKIFSTGFSGEGARNDVILGRLTANITSFQKRDLAGLADSIAKRKGVSMQDMIRNHYDELEDALKIVVQYPSRGAISSPLARTINIAFFPMRYDIKVASMVAKEIGKQPPTVQLAIVRGLFDASDWLKTDEGLAWQSENYEAIGLLRWITPVDSISNVLNKINGNVDSISDLGMLGGLPFGVIPQLLDGQGVFEELPEGLKYQTPYVNPKTGEIYEERIPQSLKARANYATIDFLNSVFTYPGRILGLPGKRQFLREVASFAADPNSSEFMRVSQDDKLTDLQKRQAEIIRKIQETGDVSDDDLVELYRSPTGVGYAIPNLEILVGTPNVPKLQERTDVESLPSGKKKTSSGPKAKKVAQPIPPRQ
jgi:hypothetical protein